MDQAAADRETESSPAKAPCCAAVDLRKALEDDLLAIQWDADPLVANRQSDPHARGGHIAHRHLDRHSSCIGEFDGIAHEVRENLPNTSGIALEALWHARWNDAAQLEPLLGGPRCEEGADLFNQLAQIEIHPLNRKFPGLDL